MSNSSVGLDYYGLMRSSQSFLKHLGTLVLAAALSAHAQAPSDPIAPAASSALDAELFYKLLLGELNAQGADASLGYSLILDAARKTVDPQLFQRAVEIALQGRSGESALQAARAWRQALPKSREANRFVLQILIGLNRLSDTVEPMQRDIALSPLQDRAEAIAALPSYFARATGKKEAAQAVEQALSTYLGQSTPQVSAAQSAWITVGRMRLFANDKVAALDAARRAQALGAQADGPALLALALMSPEQPQAETLIQKYLALKPQAEVRLAYARSLLDAQRYAESEVQIQIITREKPDFAEPWLIQGALALQNKQTETAEKSLQRYLELTLSTANKPNADQERGPVQAYLMLAQLAEQRKDFAQAEQWLSKITNAEDMVQAQTRRAGILARQDRMAEARKLMASLPDRTPAQARSKLMAEVQLLRENKLYQAAYDLLAHATPNHPTDFDLLYDQATLAEKLGDTTGMEQLLRRIIAGKPDYHHAYNALGYSLAERNIRLDEARQLILKALEFAPGDPFISDSLAWVEFKSGNKPQALQILQDAYKARPDAEIAAHLGEVLLSLDQKDQALRVWREGLQINADNETLLETLKRLRVKP
jgi:tetratricopeptide (TPR) repeat protein